MDRSKMSLVDPAWEYLDPTPDIFAMFQEFDKTFFGGTMHRVELKWSKRMTSCAGLMAPLEGKGGACSIRLSEPLLKLRPRKDLVQTLLHEMIHAHLHVTKCREKDPHGPKFKEHMNRINKIGGTNITVYHNFHDEVNLHKQHWWRCNGSCRNWRPYYGWVKRATNRAPSKNDFWWPQHQQSCGGQYIKVKEPEGYRKKKEAQLQKSLGKNGNLLSMIKKKYNLNRPVSTVTTPKLTDMWKKKQTDVNSPKTPLKTNNSSSPFQTKSPCSKNENIKSPSSSGSCNGTTLGTGSNTYSMNSILGQLHKENMERRRRLSGKNSRSLIGHETKIKSDENHPEGKKIYVDLTESSILQPVASKSILGSLISKKPNSVIKQIPQDSEQKLLTKVLQSSIKDFGKPLKDRNLAENQRSFLSNNVEFIEKNVDVSLKSFDKHKKSNYHISPEKISSSFNPTSSSVLSSPQRKKKLLRTSSSDSPPQRNKLLSTFSDSPPQREKLLRTSSDSSSQREKLHSMFSDSSPQREKLLRTSSDSPPQRKKLHSTSSDSSSGKVASPESDNNHSFLTQKDTTEALLLLKKKRKSLFRSSDESSPEKQSSSKPEKKFRNRSSNLSSLLQPDIFSLSSHQKKRPLFTASFSSNENESLLSNCSLSNNMGKQNVSRSPSFSHKDKKPSINNLNSSHSNPSKEKKQSSSDFITSRSLDKKDGKYSPTNSSIFTSVNNIRETFLHDTNTTCLTNPKEKLKVSSSPSQISLKRPHLTDSSRSHSLLKQRKVSHTATNSSSKHHSPTFPGGKDSYPSHHSNENQIREMFGASSSSEKFITSSLKDRQSYKEEKKKSELFELLFGDDSDSDAESDTKLIQLLKHPNSSSASRLTSSSQNATKTLQKSTSKTIFKKENNYPQIKSNSLENYFSPPMKNSFENDPIIIDSDPVFSDSRISESEGSKTMVMCPVCQLKVSAIKINIHLDECLNTNFICQSN